MSRRAKIIATIGPATASPDRLTALVEAGMDAARLNFSHGTHEEHAGYIEAVRQAARRAGRTITIVQDLQGPKLRTGPAPDGRPIRLEAGQAVKLSSRPGPSTTSSISISCPSLTTDL
jgi:pyruvate kinase